MRTAKLSVLWIGAALIALGCGDDDGPAATPDAGVATADAGTTGDIDAGSGDGLSCEERVPTVFGVALGRNLQPFTLQQCDGSDYSFYNEDFCAANLTVVSIAAGWCPPCIAESRQLTERIVRAYEGRGVRVIQILVQTDTYGPPDLAYCDAWVDEFGLENVELIDPAQWTQPFFPDNALPSTIIVDNQGVIRFRENGATDGLTSLQAGIDAELARQGL
jgi:hypothetical protein